MILHSYISIPEIRRTPSMADCGLHVEFNLFSFQLVMLYGITHSYNEQPSTQSRFLWII